MAKSVKPENNMKKHSMPYKTTIDVTPHPMGEMEVHGGILKGKGKMKKAKH